MVGVSKPRATANPANNFHTESGGPQMLTSSAELLTPGSGWALGAAGSGKQTSTRRCSGKQACTNMALSAAEPLRSSCCLGVLSQWGRGWGRKHGRSTLRSHSFPPATPPPPQPSRGDCFVAEDRRQLPWALPQARAGLNFVSERTTQVLGRGSPKPTHQGQQGLRPAPAPSFWSLVASLDQGRSPPHTAGI